MSAFVALLRAVNVGGTGKLPMAELKAMCVAEGFEQVQTYIASGNVVFATSQSAAEVQSALEARLLAYSGKSIAVFVRTAEDIRDIVSANPFPQNEGRNTYVHFLDAAPSATILDGLKNHLDEDIRLGKRELYIHYPQGMGRSKLKLPPATVATARNMNTVTALQGLSDALLK